MEAEPRTRLNGHEGGNPGYGQAGVLMGHRTNSRPYQIGYAAMFDQTQDVIVTLVQRMTENEQVFLNAPDMDENIDALLTAILLPSLIACLEGDGRTIAQRRVRNPYRRS